MRERQARSCGSDGAHKSAAVEQNSHVKPQRNRTWRSEGARHCIPEEGRCWLGLIVRNEVKSGAWVLESRQRKNISQVESANPAKLRRRSEAGARWRGRSTQGDERATRKIVSRSARR